MFSSWHLLKIHHHHKLSGFYHEDTAAPTTSSPSTPNLATKCFRHLQPMQCTSLHLHCLVGNHLPHLPLHQSIKARVTTTILSYHCCRMQLPPSRCQTFHQNLHRASPAPRHTSLHLATKSQHHRTPLPHLNSLLR